MNTWIAMKTNQYELSVLSNIDCSNDSTRHIDSLKPSNTSLARPMNDLGITLLTILIVYTVKETQTIYANLVQCKRFFLSP